MSALASGYASRRDAINDRARRRIGALAPAIVNPYLIAGAYAIILLVLTLAQRTTVFSAVALGAFIGGWSSAWSP